MAQRKSIIATEEIRPASPLRRSSRIATSSPAPVSQAAPVPVTRRRSSATIESTSVPAKATKAKRLSLSQDISEEKVSTPRKRAVRGASKSPTSQENEIRPATAPAAAPAKRGRRGSVNSLVDESDASSRAGSPAVDTISTRRRSLRGQSSSPKKEKEDTPLAAKPRGRRTSLTEKVVPMDVIEESDSKAKARRGRPSSVTTIQEEDEEKKSAIVAAKTLTIDLPKMNMDDKKGGVRRSLRGRSQSIEETEDLPKKIAKEQELIPIEEDKEDANVDNKMEIEKIENDAAKMNDNEVVEKAEDILDKCVSSPVNLERVSARISKTLEKKGKSPAKIEGTPSDDVLIVESETKEKPEEIYESLPVEYKEEILQPTIDENEKQTEDGNKEKQTETENKEKQTDDGNKEKQTENENKENQAEDENKENQAEDENKQNQTEDENKGNQNGEVSKMDESSKMSPKQLKSPVKNITEIANELEEVMAKVATPEKSVDESDDDDDDEEEEEEDDDDDEEDKDDEDEDDEGDIDYQPLPTIDPEVALKKDERRKRNILDIIFDASKTDPDILKQYKAQHAKKEENKADVEISDDEDVQLDLQIKDSEPPVENVTEEKKSRKSDRKEASPKDGAGTKKSPILGNSSESGNRRSGLRTKSISKSLCEFNSNVNEQKSKRLSISLNAKVGDEMKPLNKIEIVNKSPLKESKGSNLKKTTIATKDNLLLNELEMTTGSDGSFQLNLSIPTTASQDDISDKSKVDANTSVGSNSSDKENITEKSPIKLVQQKVIDCAEKTSTPKIEKAKKDATFCEPMEVEYASDVECDIEESKTDADESQKEFCTSPVKKMKETKPVDEKELLDSFVDETIDEPVMDLKNKSKNADVKTPKKVTLKSTESESDTKNTSLEKKLNDLISSQLFDLDVSSDDDKEDSRRRNEFISDEAMEGEEDTPDEDSNQIIDDGESLHTTDSEADVSNDEDYENDSFVVSDEDVELLSGNEYDLGHEKVEKSKIRRSRIIQVSDSDEEDVKIDDVKSPIKETSENTSEIVVKNDETKISEKLQADLAKVECISTKLSPAKDEHEQKVVIIQDFVIAPPTAKDTDLIVNKEDNLDSLELIKVENENEEMQNKSLHLLDVSNATETPANTPAGLMTASKASKRKSKRKSSITIQEKIDLTNLAGGEISDKISSVVDLFCSSLKQENGHVSLNVSLDYANGSSEEDQVPKKKSKKKKNRGSLNASQELDVEDTKNGWLLTKDDNVNTPTTPDKILKVVPTPQNKSASKKKKRKTLSPSKNIETNVPQQIADDDNWIDEAVIDTKANKSINESAKKKNKRKSLTPSKSDSIVPEKPKHVTNDWNMTETDDNKSHIESDSAMKKKRKTPNKQHSSDVQNIPECRVSVFDQSISESAKKKKKRQSIEKKENEDLVEEKIKENRSCLKVEGSPKNRKQRSLSFVEDEEIPMLVEVEPKPIKLMPLKNTPKKPVKLEKDIKVAQETSLKQEKLLFDSEEDNLENIDDKKLKQKKTKPETKKIKSNKTEQQKIKRKATTEILTKKSKQIKPSTIDYLPEYVVSELVKTPKLTATEVPTKQKRKPNQQFTIKPSSSMASNSSWEVNDLEISGPSKRNFIVSKNVDKLKEKLLPNDFKNRMLYDSSVPRMSKKKVSKNKTAF